MPRILVSNDDGVNAPGLLALKQALSAIGEVHVLAPETNWSACSHTRTLDKPMRVHSVRLADGSEAHTCNGSPADCVALGLRGVLETTFDLVVSGINHGYNLGNDTSYSGTVACAKEAVILGVPGIAVSTAYAKHAKSDLDDARTLSGHYAAQLAQQVLARGLSKGTLLNLNVPAVTPSEVRGVRVTRLGWRNYRDELIQRDDPYGRPYYWLSGYPAFEAEEDGTDLHAIYHDYVSITPITLDVTHHNFIEQMRNWDISNS